MNVELLERTRESVADRSKLLNLNSWRNCIAAHLFVVAGINREVSPASWNANYSAIEWLLGITHEEAVALTWLCDSTFASDHRAEALQRIDHLLAPFTPAPSPQREEVAEEELVMA